MARKGFKTISVTEKTYLKLLEVKDRHGFATISDTVAHLVALDEFLYTALPGLATAGGTLAVNAGNIASGGGTVAASTGNITAVTGTGTANTGINNTTAGTETATDGIIDSAAGTVTATSGNGEAASGSGTTSTGKAQRRRKRRRAWEILEREKVVILDDIIDKLSDPEGFVNYHRRMGAVVIEGVNTTALVEPRFYSEFLEHLEELPMNVEAVKDQPTRRLLEFLAREGLIYYDARHKRWKPVDNLPEPPTVKG